MQLNDQYDSQQQRNPQQQDIYSYPLPIRIKHPSWSIRKGTYQQLLYYMKNISSPTEQILISGSSYTIETLLPYFQNLVQEKHALVLLKGMQCVESILLLDKKAASKHCIKTLIDKGIEYFPLLSQQRKAILQKFLDILELSKIDGTFLKNKLNLPHQKSVMYVIEVIAVLNITSLKGVLVQLSKKHQKKCVRQLAAQIAQQMQQAQSQNHEQTLLQIQQKYKSTKSPALAKSQKPQQSTNCKLTIQKLPHYEQLASKKQQQYSTQLLQKIEAIIEEYSMAQLPNFSHILRLMIDDNNHIININAIKCLVAIFNKQRENSSYNKPSLVPASFPLLFIFNKFKSHKTHPINSLMLSLTESILGSTPNRVSDLILAINQGLTSAGSKANVKFGCALTFFRILSLLYQNQDLYACTTNENIQNMQNQNLQQKFSTFQNIKLGKNHLKIVEKIMTTLDKDKKYQTEMYLIKYAIGMDVGNVVSSKDLNVMNNKSSLSKVKQLQSNKNSKLSQNTNTRKPSVNIQLNSKKTTTLAAKQKNQSTSNTISLTKTLKQSKSSQKFEEINLQTTLNTIIKSLTLYNQKQQKTNFTPIQKLLQKSSQQFYQCVRQRRYEMFYLCQLLQHFIQNYQPSDSTIEHVSQYLINLLKIISLLKPLSITSPQFMEISFHNVSQLLLVALCKLVISEEIQEVLENLSQNYGFEVIYESMENLFVRNRNNKMKKKNKKFLLQWLEGNTPAMFLNDDYYRLIELINQKEQKVKSKQLIQSKEISDTKEISNPKKSFEQVKKLNKIADRERSQVNKQSISLVQVSSFRRRQEIEDLQSINLSKIQNSNSQSNDFCEDMEKSSFHQNLEQNLRQIKTNRSYQEENFNGERNYQDISRQYLKNLPYEQFKKKGNKENKILESSPFREEKDSHYQQSPQERDQNGRQQCNENKYVSQQGQDKDEQIEYNSKFEQVQRKRLERQRERREFMSRMKEEFKPMMVRKDEEQSEEQSNHSEQESIEDKRYNYQEKSQFKQLGKAKESPRRNKFQREVYQDQQDQQLSEQQKININQEQEYTHQSNQQNHNHYSQQYNFKCNNNQPPHEQNLTINYSTPKDYKTSTKDQPSKTFQQAPDCSFVSSTSSGDFKYRLLNQEKITYMLKTTTNPYPHLRTLLLIPFKSSTKKHHFLKQLIHFFNNHVEFTLPQPYTSLALLTILMFSEIKQDKTLIQPLQSLYEQVAKHSTTNDFIKTIISLFHTVIEQTLQQNRKFLITILLKSMIRMLPFIEDGLSLLRDIQQFYQIGQMVYFQMFQEEYTQIRSYMQEEAIDIILEKALEQEGYNLKSIVEGWLNTAWKNQVVATIEEYANQNSHQQQPSVQQSHNYQSYI